MLSIAANYHEASEFLKDKRESEQWKRVKAIFEGSLHDIRALNMGYNWSELGSIETAEVARVLLGRTASGRVVAIYRVDIWT